MTDGDRFEVVLYVWPHPRFAELYAEQEELDGRPHHRELGS